MSIHQADVYVRSAGERTVGRQETSSDNRPAFPSAIITTPIAPIDINLIEGFMIGLAPGNLVGLALALIGARWDYRAAWWAEIEKKRRLK